MLKSGVIHQYLNFLQDKICDQEILRENKTGYLKPSPFRSNIFLGYISNQL